MGRRLSHQQRRRIAQIQERRRAKAQARAEAMADEGTGDIRSGQVVAQYGANLVIETEDGQLTSCMARANLDKMVCGDEVVWEPTHDGQGVITACQPRRSALIRPGYQGGERPLAANIDQLVIVSAVLPELSRELIDRYLVASELTELPPLILLNKVDMLNEDELEWVEEEMNVYESLGYKVTYTSTVSDTGLKSLHDAMRGKTNVLVGQSGVGKSSLIQALLPDRDIRVGALSQATGLGRHTTTTATLYRLPDGGALIDSPGVRNYHLWNVEASQLEHGYRDFRPYLGQCRFHNCRHENEPGCAVHDAVDNDEIDLARFETFMKIRAQLEDAEERSKGRR